MGQPRCGRVFGAFHLPQCCLPGKLFHQSPRQILSWRILRKKALVLQLADTLRALRSANNVLRPATEKANPL